jgi:hypothetical protein
MRSRPKEAGLSPAPVEGKTCNCNEFSPILTTMSRLRPKHFSVSPLFLALSLILFQLPMLLSNCAPSAVADPGVTIVVPMEEQQNRDSPPVAPKKKKKRVKKAEKTEAAGEGSAKISKKEKEGDKPKELTVGGIFYGEIASVDAEKNSIFILPLDRRHNSRKTFYLDRFTEYYVDGELDELDSLHIKQKVAVRFFGEPNLRVADAVYVVSGEFNPDDYRPTKKKKKAKEKPKKSKAKPTPTPAEEEAVEEELEH